VNETLRETRSRPAREVPKGDITWLAFLIVGASAVILAVVDRPWWALLLAYVDASFASAYYLWRRTRPNAWGWWPLLLGFPGIVIGYARELKAAPATAPAIPRALVRPLGTIYAVSILVAVAAFAAAGFAVAVAFGTAVGVIGVALLVWSRRDSRSHWSH
jgi:hypothetical protein